MGPPLSSFPHVGKLDRGQSHHYTFFYLANFTPLSTVSQGGNREFTWSGFPLMLVLTHAKVRMGDMDQPYR